MPSPTVPEVSVVIPLYQKAPYIGRALKSVFSQSFKNFEVLVVDDGSSDEAASVLGQFADARLLVHTQIHAGVSAARNRGISLARAPWVGFLDADDEWLPSFLEAALGTVQGLIGVSAVFSNLRDHATGRPMLTSVDCQAGRVRDYFATLLANQGQGISSSSVLAAKSHLVSCEAFSEGVAHGQDVDLWARLAWSGEVAFCDEVGAVYHSEVPGSTSGDARAAVVPYPAILHSYEKWSATGRIPVHLRESSRRYATWLLARNVMELAHQGLREEARTRLCRAHWRDPAEPLLRKATLWLRLPIEVLQNGRRLRAFLRHARRRLFVPPPGGG